MGLRERHEELVALDEGLAAARAGRGTLVVLDGHAGIGKSRLLDHAVHRAQATGMAVLRGRGTPAEADFPFGLALQLFEQRVEQAPRGERAMLLHGAAGLASTLLAAEAPSELVGQEQLFPVLHGLYWLTVNLCEPVPLLLAIDDAHWVDAPSIRYLRYLAGRMDNLPLAVVLTHRTGEPATTGASGLLSHDGARLLRPAPLSAAAVASLVREQAFPEAHDDFCTACAEVTGGNPFLVGELLRTLVEEGVAATSAGTAAVRALTPETVSRSVLLRLSAFPADARALARAVAVLGDDAEPEHCAALAGLDADSAAVVAAGLAEAGILTPREPYSFAHPLLRSAVHGDLAAGEARRAHLRAARVLHSDGVTDDRVAAQLLASSPAEEDWAHDALCRAAARNHEGGAHATAARMLERALDEPATTRRRASTLLAWGRARVRAGQDPTAALVRAAEAADDPQVAAEAEHLLGRALFAAGRPDEAAEAVRRGLARVCDDGGDVALQLRASLAILSLFEPVLHDEVAATAAQLAATDSELTQAQRVLLASAAARATFGIGDHEDVRTFARRALDSGRMLAASAEDDAVTWTWAVAALTWADDLHGALAAASAAVEQARGAGSVTAFATASFTRATPAFWAGHLRDAIADAALAVRGHEDGWATYLGPACGLLGLGHLERGDSVAAEKAIAVAEASFEHLHPHYGGYVLHARGRLRAAQGRWSEALEDQLAAGRMGANPNPAAVPWRSAGALAARRCGQVERARELVDEELALAWRFGAPRSIGIALRAKGVVVGGDDGLALMSEAVEVLRGSPARLELARALEALGAAQRRSGARALARDTLREALDLADHCGATVIASRAREELTLAGGRPRRAAVSGVQALTPGERRVATLAADGLTNREIAESLFVTRKTVDWHLRGAYRKLGVNARDQLAALLGCESVTQQ